MGGGKKVIIEKHRHAGVFVLKGKQDAVVTLNLVPGDSVYGEKRVVQELPGANPTDNKTKVEYRVWNPFRSKVILMFFFSRPRHIESHFLVQLGAAVTNGLGDIHMKPGSRVLYLGAASGTTVSHVSDLVGRDGVVYAVEFR